MNAGQRLWRTADGKLVPDGHPDAETLAYGPADEVTGDDVKLVPKAKPDKAETTKQVEPASNKAVKQAANK